MPNFKLVVISAFGRGNWLAVKLKQKGFETILLDLTDSMGSWSPEKSEGPFGFFNTENLDNLFQERLSEDDPLLDCPQGYTIWLPDGPFELKGPNFSSRIKSLGISDEVIQYVQNNAYQKHNAAKIQSLSFKENWFAQLAHSVTQNTFVSSSQSVQFGAPSPLATKFNIRYATHTGQTKSLDWSRRKGVEVFANVKMIDLAYTDKKDIKSIEIKKPNSEKSEIIDVDQMVWCLTSHETLHLNEKIQNKLYPQGVLEPEWFWARYRLKLSESLQRESLPLNCLIINNLNQPWTHENFVILQRTGGSDIFDAWLRLPHVQRFNQEYLKYRGNALVDFLEHKLVETRCSILDFPTSPDATFQKIGPARWGIYNLSQKEKWRPGFFNNVKFDSNEIYDGLGLNFQYLNQKKIVLELLQWQEKVLIKQKQKEVSQ